MNLTVQEWLGKDNQLGIDIWNKKYRYNNESFENFYLADVFLQIEDWRKKLKLHIVIVML